MPSPFIPLVNKVCATPPVPEVNEVAVAANEITEALNAVELKILSLSDLYSAIATRLDPILNAAFYDKDYIEGKQKELDEYLKAPNARLAPLTIHMRVLLFRLEVVEAKMRMLEQAIAL